MCHYFSLGKLNNGKEYRYMAIVIDADSPGIHFVDKSLSILYVCKCL